jgi:mono/diheme cytochrome c family protein
MPRSPEALIALLLLGVYNGDVASAASVDFGRDIRPIFNQHCTSCHGGVKRAGGLSLLSREAAMAKSKSGGRAVVPGDVDQSELLKRVTSKDPDEHMPPPDHAPALASNEVARLREWIQGGAVWTKHWAYEKPIRPNLPDVVGTVWPKQDLDRFILARLESEKLAPAPEATRLAWLRRVSFDLTGLPPSEVEARDFLSDNSSQAFETAVDRLLASPRFGERWGTEWLDLARYADTMGYERDLSRVVWPWRDWVIRAFNSGMSYDQFVIRQLAGDLLPGATDDDRLATAFHRNTQTNTEDGTDDEEFRTAAVIDRIATTWEGLAGTSFRCAQCHSHPYDPFAHDEFYQFAALFNTTRDQDSNEDFPLLRVAQDENDRQKLSQLDTRRRVLRHQLYSEGMSLAATARWQSLQASRATSTGQAKLVTRFSEGDGVPEVIATGTITLNSIYTVDVPISASGVFNALRLEVLPDDLERAASLPEPGFVLSRIQLQWLPSGDEAQAVDIPLATGYDEDPDAFFEVEASLSDDPGGWCGYPRFHRKRTAVFIPAKPVTLPAGSSLRFVLSQNMQSSGIKAQAIRRLRIALSPDASWKDLWESQSPRWTEVKVLGKEIAGIPSVTVPVMAEQPPSQLRETRIFLRGNWLTQGALVAPSVPPLLGDMPVTNRLQMARWLTSPDHPLFARVAVNRFWEQLFGLGLVESSEEFGTTGQEPSHPELLDWLAVRFAGELQFEPKRLLRELVLSATYRQDSRVSSDLLARDPRNRLLARGPRQRLTAEMVRDQALSASGLLSSKMGGPPVMPQQPEGIWRTVYNGGKWVTSPGDDAYRRAIYTFIRRTSGYPSFQTFDAPSREYCTVRRLPTNTPLQALVTLNDPVYLEAAKGLATRMLTAGTTTEQRIARGWQLTTGRPMTPRETSPLMELYRQAQQRITDDPKAASALGETTELGALTVVANALLNLDTVLTR